MGFLKYKEQLDPASQKADTPHCAIAGSDKAQVRELGHRTCHHMSSDINPQNNKAL
jgi:hypothetical protein